MRMLVASPVGAKKSIYIFCRVSKAKRVGEHRAKQQSLAAVSNLPIIVEDNKQIWSKFWSINFDVLSYDWRQLKLT